ncbi:pre-mRNA cleavage complex II protein Clp1 superfamily protein [Babesia bovis T2Bo]|uniref:Pre-mRNA cleavage complex II protein Clp1, putative n=1 Tax=Babesia bovis TaxID=5865 RepID=A7ARR6_BABBO|nr:pre-mRNA cleavage complex II protein Clp1 superfamily protein [Babesia bovis T2Bo]EDO07235.1 pre-mRNA cleavage complex II protein Clp1 superfamily protein [Babesia bovis T2Bo]|eukprot:XP_001610803.1 pre-mRNA cleavage complex II protein Clp1 [Babesia bovis T2Bo]
MLALPLRTYNLSPFSELRIVTSGSYGGVSVPPTIKLLNTSVIGHGVMQNINAAAEIYGKELVPEVEYILEEGEKVAVFTWTGCSLQVKGNVEQEYEGSDHAMKEYLNVAHVLDAERELASVRRLQGPRILITGAPSSGKSTAAMILCHYAVRSGWTPIFIEADPRGSTDRRQIQFFPGVIGATVISGTTEEKPKNPLVYQYGYLNAQENDKLYLRISQVMAAMLDTMTERSSATQPQSRRSDEVTDMGKYIAASGMFVNAPHSANKDLILKLVKIYNISLVLVIDSPSVHQDLVRTYATMKDAARGSQVASVTGELLSSNVIGNLAFQEQTMIGNYMNDNDDSVCIKGDTENDDTKHPVVLAINKLEGVVPVDHERLKYLHDKCWRYYFERTNKGEMHIIRFKMDDVQLVVVESCIGLSNDALPQDEAGSLQMNETYAATWNGDAVSLTRSILGIPATSDLSLIPYSNILGFFYVRSVEALIIEPTAENGKADNEGLEDDAAIKYLVEAVCPVIYSPSSLPSHLLVPGSTRAMKWQTL